MSPPDAAISQREVFGPLLLLLPEQLLLLLRPLQSNQFLVHRHALAQLPERLLRGEGETRQQRP